MSYRYGQNKLTQTSPGAFCAAVAELGGQYMWLVLVYEAYSCLSEFVHEMDGRHCGVAEQIKLVKLNLF